MTNTSITSYKLRRFDPSVAPCFCTWLLVGRRRSGKSRLLFDLLHRTKHNYDIAFGTAETAESYEKLSQIIPTGSCKKKYDEAFVRHIVSSLRNWHDDPSRARKRAVLILDDCMYNKKIMTSDVQREMYMNGRNFFLTTFNTTQYLVDIPPAIRTNVDFVICMKEPIRENRLKLYKYFFGIFPSFDSFEKTFNIVTENYGALVLDNTKTTCTVETNVFWYRGDPDIPLSMLGKPIFFERARQRDLKRSQEDSEDILKIVVQ